MLSEARGYVKRIGVHVSYCNENYCLERTAFNMDRRITKHQDSTGLAQISSRLAAIYGQTKPCTNTTYITLHSVYHYRDAYSMP